MPRPPSAGAPDAEVDRLPAIAGALREAAGRFGTPLYVTDEATVRAATAELADAFPDPWIRQYSVKANDVAAVVALVTSPGASGGRTNGAAGPASFQPHGLSVAGDPHRGLLQT